MMNTRLITFFILCFSSPILAQFHTVKMPQASPKVKETQQLGITDITIDYASPGTRGRDVWNGVVPFEGTPIPWRAGANMNTRIQFSTDVKINGQSLTAGSYGFHIIPRKSGNWALLFAHHDNQWGSYYLDQKKDVAIQVEVKPETCPFRENMSFDFLGRTDSTVNIGLEWAEKRIPFTIEVDLNATVIPHLRYELSGINTYRWEAWNDAANWCLRRNTNLEEALSWIDRSIYGGYNGFAANINLTNLGTKLNILNKMGKEEEIPALLEEAQSIILDPIPAVQFGGPLLKAGYHKEGLDWYQYLLEKFPEQEHWYVSYGYATALYVNDRRTEAITTLEGIISNLPDERLKPRINKMISEMKAGTFKG